MISYGDLICCTTERGNTRTADQVQDMLFGVSRNIRILL